jgi:hypothetical protein
MLLAAVVAVSFLNWLTVPAAAQSPRGLQRSSASVRLVPATPDVMRECAAAATALQMSVPCPRLVPSRGGKPMDCPAPEGAQPSPCVGLEGVSEYRVFFLEFADFDVPRHYVGVDGKAVGHLIIEARRLSDAPKTPCIRATRSGALDIKGWRTTVYICPNDSSYVERVARHGEGAHAGHVLLDWKVGNIEYMASAHGHTTANLTLLERVVANITLVDGAG